MVVTTDKVEVQTLKLPSLYQEIWFMLGITLNWSFVVRDNSFWSPKAN